MKRGDLAIILIVVVVAMSGLAYNWILQNTTDPLTAEIRVDGEVVDLLDLNIDTRVEYETEYGYNVVEVLNGEVSVIAADCPDSICIETANATAVGDSIVCVPNRFTVEILGEGGEVDVISQ